MEYKKDVSRHFNVWENMENRHFFNCECVFEIKKCSTYTVIQRLSLLCSKEYRKRIKANNPIDKN